MNGVGLMCQIRCSADAVTSAAANAVTMFAATRFPGWLTVLIVPTVLLCPPGVTTSSSSFSQDRGGPLCTAIVTAVYPCCCGARLV